MNPTQLTTFLREYGDLRPAEVKMMLYLYDRLNANGGEPAEISLAEIKRDTRLSYGTVQKYHLSITDRGVFRLLSSGRKRSRYALPVSPQSEPHVPATSRGEEIFNLLTQFADFTIDPVFTSEAEQRAGGQQQLLACLHALDHGRGRKRSRASLLALISRVSYNLGFARDRA